MTLPAQWTEASSPASVRAAITSRSAILPWELFMKPSAHRRPPPCLIRAPSCSVWRIIQANLIVATLEEIRKVIFFEGDGEGGGVINERDISLYVWLILSRTCLTDVILTLVCIDRTGWIRASGNEVDEWHTAFHSELRMTVLLFIGGL